MFEFWKFTEVYSQGSNWQYPSIGLDNGLTPNGRQAIIWTNAAPILWRIYAALGGDELNSKRLTAKSGNVVMNVSLWNFSGISAAALWSCLTNFRAIGKALTQISLQVQNFKRSCDKTPVRLMNRGPGCFPPTCSHTVDTVMDGTGGQ